jgi:hypothetical protein
VSVVSVIAPTRLTCLRPDVSNRPPNTVRQHRLKVEEAAVYAGDVSDEGSRTARLEDVHELALAMPHVTVEYGTGDNPIYQVGGKSFIFFRNPRPDAIDPETLERYRDVIVFWVASEADKQALVQDEASPFFTTAHFDGHPSVLLRASRIGELTRQEVAELVEEAWLSRASRRRAATWLSAHPPVDRRSSPGPVPARAGQPAGAESAPGCDGKAGGDHAGRGAGRLRGAADS